MTTRVHLFLLLLVVAGPSCTHSNEEETVETWATKLGEEIWELGLLVTRIPEIRQKYKVLNARVLPTDGEAILNTIVTNVNRMMKSKMDAVMCLIQAAEELSESFEYNASSVLDYRSAKMSQLLEEESTPQPIVPKRIQDEEFFPEYRPMQLDKDNHFYGIPVNTEYSAVHVPTDVFDQADNVKEHIQWSEALDEVFVKNYRSDPTLKWQYFGGSSGFLRLYPALRWNGGVDEFDCRTRPWFIEAATCSKDVVILVDNSGSMTGMRSTIARQTVNAILKTFSNNDFINIFAFSNVSSNIVPCFTGDMLVQATQENIKTFQEAIDSIKPDGKANFTDAYITAFNLLEQYRERRNCPQRTCNQAVMLVTDSVTDNLTEVFQTYNWFDNRTHVPVRVFTYLIGREVTKVREIQWMACLNRGYYVHIQTLEEAQGQVLKYIPVVARPLVLQGVEHPLSWTHPFADITDPAVSNWLWDVMDFDDQKQRLWNHSSNQNDYFSQRKEDNKYIRRVTQGDIGEDIVEYQEYRMMTSVSGPAFDRKKNNNNETKSADLLGIAGTDVHIKDIEKLTLAYKIGANGYAFIITNNGYLMSHPDLRPVHKGILKDNYNSVDLTEVELLDDNVTDHREPSEEILELRRIMVEHSEGKTLNLKMKFHYDDFRRVGAETRHYYYAPLENTSFSLGLVLPHSYGNYWIKAGDEIRKTYQMGESVADYFKGNWRIHPDWVYCDYHRDTSHWNESREERLVEFMKRMRSPNWKWHEQYPNAPVDEDVCKKRPIGDDEYYCDKELMQLLVFDGKSTQLSYEQKKYIAKSRRELELVNKYNVSLRFVATQSGLTRWQYIKERGDEQNEWGDSNNEALNEPWYRSAVLQHHIDADAFVLSVPFDPDRPKTVTASHAIFHRDGGHEAPGSVVGFHFPYENLYNSFNKIISKSNCPDCEVSCQSDTHDCYIIDGNGYVVWSRTNLTGQFFGDMEGAVMEAMVSKNIFRRIKMFDYQGLCFDTVLIDSGAISLLTPFKHLFNLVMSMSSTLLWYLMELSLWRPVYSYDDEVAAAYNPTSTPNPEGTEEDSFSLFYNLGDFLFKYYDEIESGGGGAGEEGGEKVFYRRKQMAQARNVSVPRPCDRQGDLYLLQHLSKEGYHSSTIVNCSRPFIVKRIPHTNLLLIVINALYQSCYVKLNAEMTEIEYNNTYGPNQSCQKLYLNTLPRRKLTGCFSEHPLENEIITCGRGSHLEVHSLLLAIVTVIPLLTMLSNTVNRN